MKELYEDFLLKNKEFRQVQMQDLKLMQELENKKIEGKYLDKDENYYKDENQAKLVFMTETRPPIEEKFIFTMNKLLKAIEDRAQCGTKPTP